MKSSADSHSRRERQIMEILYRRGRATVSEIREALPDNVGYSGVRALLAIMERKGQVRHVAEGIRYVYEPSESATEAADSALERVRDVFFGGSAERVVAALLSGRDQKLSPEEVERIEKMIREAREEG